MKKKPGAEITTTTTFGLKGKAWLFFFFYLFNAVVTLHDALDSAYWSLWQETSCFNSICNNSFPPRKTVCQKVIKDLIQWEGKHSHWESMWPITELRVSLEFNTDTVRRSWPQDISQLVVSNKDIKCLLVFALIRCGIIHSNIHGSLLSTNTLGG